MVSGSGCRQPIEQVYQLCRAWLHPEACGAATEDFDQGKKAVCIGLTKKFVQAFLYDVMAGLGSQVP